MGSSKNIKAEVLHKDSIRALISACDFFDDLAFEVPEKVFTEIKLNGKISQDIGIIFIGKTGYGKSTLINEIIGKEVFATSDVESCTKNIQTARFTLPKGDEYHLSLYDLPGIGESLSVDEKYIELYEEMINNATLVVYLMRADQRDYSLDRDLLDSLFMNQENEDKLVVALNFLDKIEPLQREKTSELTEKQQENYEKKKYDIACSLGIEEHKFIGISATDGSRIYRLLFYAHLYLTNLILEKEQEELDEFRRKIEELKYV